MATLAVLVHYDPHGEVADHVAYGVRQLRPVADRLLFVTAGPLSGKARSRLDLVDEVIERDNTGYDFGSWRAGLAAVPEWADYDKLVLANDSFVGPLVPAQSLLNAAGAGVDAYGITMSQQVVPHLQSYFMVFGPAVLRLPSFGEFWRDMVPLDDRAMVIERYELGLGRLLAASGLRLGCYFTPTAHEVRLMAARIASYHRAGAARPLAAAAAYCLQPVRRVVESPVLGLWDRVFDDARLPAVKVSLFSRNPYRIDRDAALARLQAAYPAAFDGFGAYLRRIGVSW
jgi:lipopolysaccharide biosynthesis protein